MKTLNLNICGEYGMVTVNNQCIYFTYSFNATLLITILLIFRRSLSRCGKRTEIYANPLFSHSLMIWYVFRIPCSRLTTASTRILPSRACRPVT